VQARYDPRTAIVLCGIVQRDPASKILLWLGKGITIVLMPREFIRIAWLLINSLVPIET
jgi:hypothetical protein